eukprot:349649-Chlamydomonas_euryale.AAC.9
MSCSSASSSAPPAPSGLAGLPTRSAWELQLPRRDGRKLPEPAAAATPLLGNGRPSSARGGGCG